MTGKKQVKGILLGLMAGLFVVSEAWAFCVSNATATPLFARSLDSSKFQADIAPGKQKCCPNCINPRRGKTSLLIVSGYVPVSKNSQPGWQGECRVDTAESGNITVTGSITSLSCR
jgi:hypothetical protein